MRKNHEFVYVSSDSPIDEQFNSQIKGINFSGLPCPQKEVVEIIGEGGVKQIDAQIKEMIRWKMTLFGKKSSKVRFPSNIDFFDKNNPDLCITCSPLIVALGMKNFEALRNKYFYPERIGSDKQSYNMELCKYADSIKDAILKILNNPF